MEVVAAVPRGRVFNRRRNGRYRLGRIAEPVSDVDLEVLRSVRRAVRASWSCNSDCESFISGEGPAAIKFSNCPINAISAYASAVQMRPTQSRLHTREALQRQDPTDESATPATRYRGGVDEQTTLFGILSHDARYGQRFGAEICSC